MERPKFKAIGKSIPRYDAHDKVTGALRYLEDMSFTGLLYGKVLRSPHPYAKIKSIDISAAEALPGVRAVITFEDTSKKKFSFAQAFADKYMLASGYVRYVGDEVAAVAADDPFIAAKAIDLIKVEYEVLKGVYDPEEALLPDAPLVHPETDKKSNVSWEVHRAFGDVDKAFAECDYVMEHKYTTSQQYHCCMETCGAVAQWKPSGRITLWGPFQAPHTVRQEIARILDVPRNKVTLNRTLNGGGFGQRVVIDMISPISALLSRKAGGRPVQVINSREEEFLSARGRYPYVINLKTGYNKDGRLVAQAADIIMNNGAYNDKGIAIANYSGRMFCTLYNVPNLKWDVRGVYTNCQYNTAFRGFGSPQTHFAMETQMDRIAEHLGMDPVDVRYVNCNKPGDHTISGAYLASCAMKECIDEAVLVGKWKEKRAESGKHGNKLRGTGMATLLHTGSGGRYYFFAATETFVKISEDGLVSLITGCSEIGQGIQTVAMQVAMEVLGVHADRIRIVDESTDAFPYDLGAWGSRQTFVIGNSVKAACEDAKKEVLDAAGELVGKDPEVLDITDEKLLEMVNGKWVDTGKTYEEIVDFCYSKLGHNLGGRGRYFDEEAPDAINRVDFCSNIVAFTFGCQMAQVEVDIDTGKIEIVDFVAAQEAGTMINPLNCEGQLEGSIAQGMGYALTERPFRVDGVPAVRGFVDYKVLGAMDMPPMKIAFVEKFDDPNGPFGAKGIGEPGLNSTAAAINNAIFDAVGVRFEKLPILPEDVLRALKEKGIK